MKKFFLAVVALSIVGLTGCATNSGTGALGGAAGGALIGQAIGHSTGATLLGAGIGALGGAIIGNEADKANAAQGTQPVVYQQSPPVEIIRQEVVVMPSPECRYRKIWVEDQYGRHKARALLCPNQYGEWVPVRQ